MTRTWRTQIDRLPAGETLWPARVSIPLPPDSTDNQGFSVRRPNGDVVSAQHRALTRWPDGSPRWVQIDFQTDQTGEHVVTDEKSEAQPTLPVQTQQSGDSLDISVGRLSLSVTQGQLDRVAWQSNTSGVENPISIIVTTVDGTTWQLKPTSPVDVECDGSHRVQLSWNCHHVDSNGEQGLEAKCRLELLAGIEGFSFGYQFKHTLPGQDWLEIRSIEVTIDTGAQQSGKAALMQQAYHDIGLPRYARVTKQVDIKVDRVRFRPYVDDPQTIGDEHDYPAFLEGINQELGSTIAIEQNDVAILCALRDLTYQRPKTISVTPNKLVFGIWPESAGTLRLPQGRSHRQIFDFRFTDPDETIVNRILTTGNETIQPIVAWLDPQDSIHAGPSWEQAKQLDPGASGAGFFSNLLQTGAKRWRTVAEMFHYGDSPDDGYGETYPAAGRLPKDDNVEHDFTFHDDGHNIHDQWHKARELPKVWSNNEYDAIFCLALEAMRTRNADLWRKMYAAGRHQIEVDFLHYGDHWQRHRGTPAHSYDHNAGTGIIPSHQWTQGLYYYYALTGDDDVPEVVRAICDKNIEMIQRKELDAMFRFNRELGWALVALVFGYELTGDRKYIDFAQTVIDKLKENAEPPNSSKELDPIAAGYRLANLGSNFNYNTIVVGLKCFHQATGDEKALELLQRWIDVGWRNYNNRATGVKVMDLFPEAMLYLCDVTGDYTMLRKSLWQMRMFFYGFNDLYWLEGGNTTLDTKRFTRIYRGLSWYLGSMSRQQLLEGFEGELMGDDE